MILKLLTERLKIMLRRHRNVQWKSVKLKLMDPLVM